MKLIKIFAIAALGLGVSFSNASASPVALCSTGSGLACLVNGGQFGTNNSGNDKEPAVESALAAALSLSSIDLKLLGKSDGGYGSPVSGKSGMWSTPDIVSYFTVKAANSFILFDGANLAAGSWSTSGILNNGGKQPTVSHISYWKTDQGTPPDNQDPPSSVPLPAAGWLLLAGIGGMAAMRRRRTRS